MKKRGGRRRIRSKEEEDGHLVSMKGWVLVGVGDVKCEKERNCCPSVCATGDNTTMDRRECAAVAPGRSD